MKSIIIHTAIFLCMFTCFSCVDDISEPVDSCSFTGNRNNTNNPYNELYRDVLQEYVSKGLPGISIAVETPDYGWWVGAAGMAQVEEGIPMTACNLHHTEWPTTTYTATLIMSLYEAGQLDLDDKISDYLDEEIVNQITNADEATIRQLLTSTSGIVEYDDNLKMYVDAFNNPIVQNSTEFLLKNYVYGKPAYSGAGEQRNYGITTGYALLGMIIEEASGMTYGEYLKQAITGPLGLENTYFREYPGPAEEDPTVNSYFEHFPGELQNITDLQKSYTKIAIGDQGILSTPYEMARFLQELMWGNIVDSTSLALMKPGMNDLSMRIWQYDTDYGIAYGINGGSVGAMLGMQYFPDDEITVVMATNLGAVFESKTTEMFGYELLPEVLAITFTGKRN